MGEIEDSARGLLIVVSSPSGAGKTTLCHRLIEEFPEVMFSVSYTTRPRRRGEEEGIDYHFVDDAEYMVKVPQGLRHLGVLAEPASVCAKAIEQAFLAQNRLQVWQPKRAFVLGAGQIGLLATMMLKLYNMEVYTVATKPGPQQRSSTVAPAPIAAACSSGSMNCRVAPANDVS